MNILVQMSHPAHFHLFKNAIKNWRKDSHSVFVLIKTKDILEDLLIAANIPYYNIMPISHRNSRFGIAWDMFVRDLEITWFCIWHDIDMLVGSTVEIAHISWLLNKYSVNFCEDDASVIPAFGKAAGNTIQTFLTPITCFNGKYEPKSIKYSGFHKLAYLHPNQFTPDIDIVKKYIPTERPYFILRFAELKAYHDLDAGALGINTVIAQRLIDILSPHGNIYITSERQLEPQFEKYRLIINPLDIHHVMAFARLYIGDSQSMAVEAAILGTPNIRFNNFCGRIGVLEELEQKYKLTVGVHSQNPGKLYSLTEEWVKDQLLTARFKERRQEMLNDKIDVTAFFTWFIEKYPKSKRIMINNPEYQYTFK